MSSCRWFRWIIVFAVLLYLESCRANKISAVFIFGDSIADVGNNNYIPTLSRANFKPCGIDFGKPTGRFTNGRTAYDIIGQTLGLKNFIPPYLAPTTVGSVILHVVNYASGAGGILNETGANYYGRIPMDLQLHSFAKTKDDIISLIGKPAAQKLLANALFSSTMGSNDFVNNYILPPASNHTRKLMPPKIFIGILISTYRKQLKTLYSMGARKIVVSNIPPMGCCPYLRDLYPSPDQECAAFPNNLAQLFNHRLRRLLLELTRKLKGSTFVYANVYNIVQDILKNYKSHGFEVADVSCCGTLGTHSGIVPCVPNAKVCPDRSKYLFWDPYHVTENAYKIIAKRIMDGDSKDISPMNVRALSKI